MAGAGGQLLERQQELAAIDDALRAARAGEGAVVLVEGPPGIGKTELLTTAATRARRRRMRVLVARGGELELSMPYGVVRQLFEAVVAGADDATRDRLLAGAATHAETVVDPRAEPRATVVEPSTVLHGLYWRPRTLPTTVRCYSSSTTCIGAIQRRRAGSCISPDGPKACRSRSSSALGRQPGAGDRYLERLRAVDGLRHVEPAPLSLAAVDLRARATLGDQVERTFSEACRAATGGTPFYVAELLRALRQDRVAGRAADVEAIDGLTPRTVIDATLAQLGGLPDEARTVAEAIALLGPSAELRWIAALSGLALDVVVTAADTLLSLGLLGSVAPCAFTHPILRAAVEGEIAPARRGRLHLEAARMLAAAEMPVDTVAAHLLQAPPLGEPWIVTTLRRAAEQASAQGAPAGAADYLERALIEQPPSRVRHELLLAIGLAESQIPSPRAIQHLREALALAEHPDDLGVAGLWLGQALYNAGALDDAFATLSDVVERTDGATATRCSNWRPTSCRSQARRGCWLRPPIAPRRSRHGPRPARPPRAPCTRPSPSASS